VKDDVVNCLLDGLELLPNEEFMIDAGRGDAVVQIRMEYQQAIEATCCRGARDRPPRRLVRVSRSSRRPTSSRSQARPR
jgi:hypothetical protein